MNAIVFDTPGLIPLEAFTTFGVNAKPENKNPIGYFGTGLKYAIAVLVRENIPVTIWIGRHQYIFTQDEQDFRGKGFTFIALKRNKGGFFSKVVRLPFTTDLGKNWELWQAFRELYANTLDENGEARELQLDQVNVIDQIMVDQTRIIVDSDKFVEEFRKRDEIFQLEGWVELAPGISIKPQSSKHLYYRGMRVYDMPKDVHSIYTYNITDFVDLTEDRTLKSPWWAEHQIKRAIVTCHNKEFIYNVLKGSDKTYEGRLDFEHVDFVPSDEFKQASYKPSAHYGSGSVHFHWARGYVDRVAPQVPRPVDEVQVIRQALDLIDREDWYGFEWLLKMNRPTFRKVLNAYLKGGDLDEEAHEGRKGRQGQAEAQAPEVLI